jgi:hypothetical protein
METGSVGGILHLVRGTGLTDGQLLEGFLARGDEAALATLVRTLGGRG